VNYHQVERLEFKGEIWASQQRISDDLHALFNEKDRLIVMKSGEPPYRVVLGVPHQAAIGVGRIAEKADKDRVSDEAAAFYALAAFSNLVDQGIPCKFVVMAHATSHDPNKHIDSPYCKEIFSDDTKLLFECHGAAADRRDLELSAGRNHLSNPKCFGRLLARQLNREFPLGVQKKAGCDQALVFDSNGEISGCLKNPAIGTESLIEAEKQGIAALHLEATPKFRKSKDQAKTVTNEGMILGRAIAESIISYLGN